MQVPYAGRQRLGQPLLFCQVKKLINTATRSSLVAQWVKYQVLSLQVAWVTAVVQAQFLAQDSACLQQGKKTNKTPRRVSELGWLVSESVPPAFCEHSRLLRRGVAPAPMQSCFLSLPAAFRSPESQGRAGPRRKGTHIPKENFS